MAAPVPHRLSRQELVSGDTPTPGAANRWSVYILRCDDGSLYTGVSTDVERRFAEHAGNARGARYFNGRTPVAVAWREDGHTRSSAHRREAQIKRLSRREKLRLVRGGADPEASG